MITESDRRTAQFVLKETVRSHTALKKWQDWCAGLTAAKKAAGLFDEGEDYGSQDWVSRSTAVERQYMLTHKRPVMPSETRKNRMYDSTYRVAALVGLDIPAGSINTMEDVFRTLTSATAVLAVS